MMNIARQFSLLPESELLVWCARTVVRDEVKSRIRQTVQAPLNWAVVLDLAWYHGVGPLLHRNLSTLCADLVPVESLVQLRQRTQAGALINRVLAEELVVLCDAFEANGVPVIPIKGATLATSVYGDLTLRDFNDIDLLIPEGSIAEARALLLVLGYERRDAPSDAGEACHEDEPYHVFIKKRTMFRVDLQYVMTHLQFRFRLDRPEFWQHRRPVVLMNRTVQGLAPEDLLIVLCVHGSKHVWEELKWICDVTELLRSHPHLDWNRVFSSASAWRCRRLVYMGLSLAHRILDAPLPDAVLARFADDSDVQILSHRVPSTLLADHHVGVNQSEAVAVYFSLKDSWWERWKFGLVLCRDGSPLAMTPPAWFRWRISLSRLARFVLPFHWAIRNVFPSTIREAINRWILHSV
ncbi:MAG: nucleotidyltransferase family protein [Nitrospira sp.]